MARKGKAGGTAFNGSAGKGNKNIRLGVGKKVAHFNSKLPGGGGSAKMGRVVVRSNARGHGPNGFSIVTGGTDKNTPGRHAKPGEGGLGI